MFFLVSEYGNEHKATESERKRDELLRLGYTEVMDDIQGAKPYVSKAKRRKTTPQSATPPASRLRKANVEHSGSLDKEAEV